MNNSPSLAIDFGTSRTKVAYFDENKHEPRLVELGRAVRDLIPSIFYIPKEDDGEIMVGDDAEEMIEHDPGGIVVAIKKEIHKPGKLRLSDGRKSDRIELASHLFSHIKKFTESNVSYFQGKSIGSCTLTVPVCFSGPQRDAIRKAAERGGFRNIQIMEEPVAAARSWLWETHVQGIKSVIVCDIGGGTTDFAAVRLERSEFLPIPEIPTGGFTEGGDNIDEAIVDILRDEDEETNTHRSEFWSMLGNLRSAFKTKIRKVKEFAARAKKEQFVHMEGEKLPVPPETINNCVSLFVDHVCNELENYLKICREKLGDEKPPILLVGGSSKLSGLENRVKQIVGDLPVYRWERSDYAIVLGATLEGKMIMSPPVDKQDTLINENIPETSPRQVDPQYEVQQEMQGLWPNYSTSTKQGSIPQKPVINNTSDFKKKEDDVVEIIPNGPPPKKISNSPILVAAFFAALQNVDIDALRVCVENGIDVNSSDDLGTPALCIIINLTV